MPVTTDYNIDNIGIRVNNNTVANSDKIGYDLSSYFQSNDDFSFNFGEFGYNQIGDLTDNNYEFESGFLGSDVVSGDNFDSTISFDTLSSDSIFYGAHMSTLPKITLQDAITMYSAGGDILGKGDLELPDITRFYEKNSNLVQTPLISSGTLLAPFLIGGLALRRNKFKKNK